MTGELICAKLIVKQGDGGLPLYLIGLLVPSPLYGNISSLCLNTNIAKSEPFIIMQSFKLKYNPNVTGNKKHKEKKNGQKM